MTEDSKFRQLSVKIHADNVAAGWWSDLQTGQRIERNVGELLMLVVSEAAEAAEGVEYGLKDDKLPDLPMMQVELADMAIRLFDIGGGLDLDFGGALLEPSLAAVDVFADHYTDLECLMSLVRLVASAMEGHRKNKSDPLAPRRKQIEVRLALVLRGIWELATRCSYDMDSTIERKRAFNRVRADHQVENRRAAGGKRY